MRVTGLRPGRSHRSPQAGRIQKKREKPQKHTDSPAASRAGTEKARKTAKNARILSPAQAEWARGKRKKPQKLHGFSCDASRADTGKARKTTKNARIFSRRKPDEIRKNNPTALRSGTFGQGECLPHRCPPPGRTVSLSLSSGTGEGRSNSAGRMEREPNFRRITSTVPSILSRFAIAASSRNRSG